MVAKSRFYTVPSLVFLTLLGVNTTTPKAVRADTTQRVMFYDQQLDDDRKGGTYDTRGDGDYIINIIDKPYSWTDQQSATPPAPFDDFGNVFGFISGYQLRIYDTLTWDPASPDAVKEQFWYEQDGTNWDGPTPWHQDGEFGDTWTQNSTPWAGPVRGNDLFESDWTDWHYWKYDADNSANYMGDDMELAFDQAWWVNPATGNSEANSAHIEFDYQSDYYDFYYTF